MTLRLRKRLGELERAGLAYMRTSVSGQAGDVLSEEQDLAGGRRDLTVDQVEQRGLARTVGPDDGQAFADRDVEGDVLQDPDPTEELGQVLGLKGVAVDLAAGSCWFTCLVQKLAHVSDDPAPEVHDDGDEQHPEDEGPALRRKQADEVLKPHDDRRARRSGPTWYPTPPRITTSMGIHE